MADDLRRHVPRTDAVLADPRLQVVAEGLNPNVVKDAVRRTLQEVRDGAVPAADVVGAALERLGPATTLTPVLNATGIVLHTNLGRAPLSRAAIEAMTLAAGCVDVEFDLATGARARRGRGALAALRAAMPEAGDVLVVNNGAAALVLATTELAGGREVVVSRGEMVEIGDGFRLPDLIMSTGARMREVGTTNRTNVHDYAQAVGDDTGCILKVHTSNFTVEGFTSSVGVGELSGLGVPVVADLGSGLLSPDPLLPDEPDVESALRAGASVVTCSGDKLLGGPQAGLLFGPTETIERLRRNPLARALRVDKLTLAALEATLRGPVSPTWQAMRADDDHLRRRSQQLAEATGGELVRSTGAVGGGAAPGQVLASWAVALEFALAERLRRSDPCVVGRIERGRCLLDLRCIATVDDDRLTKVVLACMS